MKVLMKAKKNIAGMNFSVSAGDIVYGTRTGNCYTISPLDNNDVSMAGIPPHYLEKV